jgi:glycosyltransferase involved in cell wall biosynthesis
MRILFTSHYALPHHGGIEVVIDQLARALVRRGHEVTHLASDAGQDGPRERPYRFIPVRCSNILERRLGVPVPLFHPELLLIAHREVRCVDVIHAHGFLYPSSALALLGARLRLPQGPVRVLTEHVGHVHYDSAALNAVEAAAIATLGRAVARSAEGIVVFNRRVEQELRRLAPAADLHWIRNGVETALFHPPEPGEKDRLRRHLGWDDRPRVLFVGRLVAKKGFDLVVASARNTPSLQFVAVGRGEPPRDLPANVALFGEISREQVAELYRASDALLLPSRGEGFPLAVQEALASSIPAFVLADTGLQGYEDLRGLHHVAPEGTAIARTIQEQLARPAETERTPIADWESVAAEHERLYLALQDRRRERQDR